MSQMINYFDFRTNSERTDDSRWFWCNGLLDHAGDYEWGSVKEEDLFKLPSLLHSTYYLPQT